MRFLIRIPVPWVFVLTYLIGLGVELVSGHHIFGPRILPGEFVLILGLLIAGWGWTTFRIARTTTVPGRASVQLVTWGPYRFTRNPMYVGLTIGYLGEAILLGHFWPTVFLPVVWAYVNWVVIPVEEAKLGEVFGDAYAEYRRRVRRWV